MQISMNSVVTAGSENFVQFLKVFLSRTKKGRHDSSQHGFYV